MASQETITGRTSDRLGVAMIEAMLPLPVAGMALTAFAFSHMFAVPATFWSARRLERSAKVMAFVARPKPVVATSRPLPGSDVRDDLTRIKGIGPKLSETLAGLGIRGFAQIAALSSDQVAAVEAELGGVKGRIMRDDWMGQAARLIEMAQAEDVSGT